MAKIKQLKVTKLLAPTTTLVLKVDEGTPEEKRLELELAWTMGAVLTLEKELRDVGEEVNIFQDPAKFWTQLSCTKLAFGIWAAAQQEHPEYAGDEGFQIISSYLTPDNYAAAAIGLKECFLESLSKARRDEIRKAEAVVAEKTGVPTDPTSAPAQ